MSFSVKFGETNIEYDVTYSKRKTLEISIKAPNIVMVKSPESVSQEKIEQSVKSKGRWIVQKLYLLSKINYRPIKREYVPGESFMYLGRNYSLRVILNESIKTPEVKLYRGKFLMSTPIKDEAMMKDAMKAWYKQKAQEMIEKRVEYYSRHFKIKPNGIKIKAQKTRWGSCTFKNDLLFNYKVIMAPSHVLDYIVVHEMCHMEHKDHSKAYWRRVSSILPDYKDRKQWLREHGVKMDI